MAIGNPHLLSMLISWLIMIWDVVVLKGIASGHLVARSMHVSMNLKPPVAVGNDPTRDITLPNVFEAVTC